MIKPLQPGFHPRENRPISRCRRGCMVFHFRMLIMSYGTESKSRNADFMFIARKGDTTTLGAKGPVNPRAAGASNLNSMHPGRKAPPISYFFYISLTKLCYNIFKRIKIRSRPFCSLFF